MSGSGEAVGFAERAEERANDERHRHWILRVIQTYETSVAAGKQAQFTDWEGARQHAAAVKREALARLPELLAQFEQGFQARGGTVLWARDKAEALQHIDVLLQRHGVQSVVKSKSMTTEELELNPFLEAKGIETVESDLGELIVQLAKERPYHIVTPAMHKSRHDVSELFQRTLGSAPTSDPRELTQIAREHLRERYLRADLGITGGNFIIADEGAIAITENEGNARLSASCPKVHLAIVGIEKVLPRLEVLGLFWPMLATSGTGQHLTSYNSLVRGPRQRGELAGPEFVYVLLLDNGRSRTYDDEAFRQSLACIRCGACLNACPVYRSIGGHAYNTAYNGPIGSVITPQLQGQAGWQHLAFASSLCGACSEVCPVRIDLHGLLQKNRVQAQRQGQSNRFWASVITFWAWVVAARWRVELARRWARWGRALLGRFFPKRLQHLPQLAEQSFAERWKELEEVPRSEP